MLWIMLILGVIAVILVVRTITQARPGLPIEEAKAAVKSGLAVLVDVREPDEWKTGVAQHSVMLPFSDLRGTRQQWTAFLKKNRGRKILLYCASGTRSGFAANQLRQEGFDALNVGSLAAWSKADWPVGMPKVR